MDNSLGKILCLKCLTTYYQHIVLFRKIKRNIVMELLSLLPNEGCIVIVFYCDCKLAKIS